MKRTVIPVILIFTIQAHDFAKGATGGGPPDYAAHAEFVVLLEQANQTLDAFEKGMLGQGQNVRREYSYKCGEATLAELLDGQRAFNETIQGYNEACAELARRLVIHKFSSNRTISAFTEL